MNEETRLKMEEEGLIVPPITETRKVNLTKYGRARLRFLRENPTGEYMAMLTDGTLPDHLIEVQERCEMLVQEYTRELIRRVHLPQMPWQEGARMRMLIQKQAEEMAMQETVYTGAERLSGQLDPFATA